MKNEFRHAAPAAKGRRRRLLLFLVTLLALLIIVIQFATGGAIGNAARAALSPVWSVGAGIGNAIGESGFFSSRRALEAEVTALQNELQESQARAAAFSVVQAENSQLSQMAHLAQTSSGITAPIDSSVIASPYGTFEIGAGSADGVAAGSIVLNSEGFVLGIVSQVGAHQSLVEETLASGNTIDVVIDGAPATMTGSGDNGTALVPNGVTVAPGDPVIAPSFGGRPVGIVGHVDSNPANAQMKIGISLPAGLSTLEFVYVTTS